MAYQTQQKQLIISCLENSKDTALTAEEISSYLLKNGTSVNLATIYRNLEKLTAEGSVVKFPCEAEAKSCYKINEKHDCHEHLHLKCSNCGKVFHLDCHFMDEFVSHITEEHGFKMNFENTIIYGLCKDCQK